MPSVPESGLENSIASLTQTIWKQHKSSGPDKRTLVSISGIPGSGKSTLARQLAASLNKSFAGRSNGDTAAAAAASHVGLSNPSPHAFAIDIPMDGYHLSRAQLRALPDPETAIHRRGAAFTYDAAAYCRLVEQLAQPITDEVGMISAPAFDHATKDPVADSICVGTETRIVLLEGNYVNLDEDPWRAAAALFDVRLMVVVDRRVARARLVKRHVASGICTDEEAARWRVESTDDLNADHILRNIVEEVEEVEMRDQSKLIAVK